MGEDNLYRIRTGDYRIIYQVRDKQLIVLVIAVGHRSDIYRLKASVRLAFAVAQLGRHCQCHQLVSRLQWTSREIVGRL